MADQINDGGPAFPFLELDGAGMPYQQNPGVTVRDYFAAKAMQGMLGGHWPDSADTEETVRRAYLMADSMLKARSA